MIKGLLALVVAVVAVILAVKNWQKQKTTAGFINAALIFGVGVGIFEGYGLISVVAVILLLVAVALIFKKSKNASNAPSVILGVLGIIVLLLGIQMNLSDTNVAANSLMTISKTAKTKFKRAVSYVKLTAKQGANRASITKQMQKDGYSGLAIDYAMHQVSVKTTGKKTTSLPSDSDSKALAAAKKSLKQYPEANDSLQQTVASLGYTDAAAEYAVEHISQSEWNNAALKIAKKNPTFSKKAMQGILSGTSDNDYSSFNKVAINYVMGKIDWNQQAVNKLNDIIDDPYSAGYEFTWDDLPSKNELYKGLTSDNGFSDSQANYAVNKLNFSDLKVELAQKTANEISKDSNNYSKQDVYDAMTGADNNNIAEPETWYYHNGSVSSDDKKVAKAAVDKIAETRWEKNALSYAKNMNIYTIGDVDDNKKLSDSELKKEIVKTLKDDRNFTASEAQYAINHLSQTDLANIQE